MKRDNSSAETLESRAKQICATGLITQTGKKQFRVPSQSKNKKCYNVNLAGNERCTCIYFFKGNAQCKHIIAAKIYCDKNNKKNTPAGSKNDCRGARDRCRLNCKCGQAGCTGAADGAEKCGCICRCRKDPKAYDFVTMMGKTDLLRMILEIIDMVGEPPYELGVGFGGKRGHDPRVMTAIVIMKTFLKTGSRNMVGVLSDNSDLRRLLGISRDDIPRKTAICDAYQKIPPEYLRKANYMLTAEIERGSLAVDSTGMSTNRFEKWSSIKKEDGEKKGYQKLHANGDIESRTIIDFEITPSNISDIAMLRVFLDRAEKNDSDKDFSICADSIYLDHDICTKIEKLRYDPMIMPKSNTVTGNIEDDSAWQRMINFAEQRPEEFKKKYNKRSIIECMFGAFKRVYGNDLRMRRPDSRRIELSLKVLCYNAERICRNRFSKYGSVYPELENCPDGSGRSKGARTASVSPAAAADASANPTFICKVLVDMIDRKIIQLGDGHSMDDTCRQIVQDASQLPEQLLFYPPGSDQRAAVLKAADRFEKTAIAVTA